MARPACDWCDEQAIVSLPADGSACKLHLRDLERRARQRISDSGDQDAGESAASLIDLHLSGWARIAELAHEIDPVEDDE